MLELKRMISKENIWILVAKALTGLIVQMSVTCGYNLLKDFTEG